MTLINALDAGLLSGPHRSLSAGNCISGKEHPYPAPTLCPPGAQLLLPAAPAFSVPILFACPQVC